MDGSASRCWRITRGCIPPERVPRYGTESGRGNGRVGPVRPAPDHGEAGIVADAEHKWAESA
jgi:hypothetical protein